MGWKDDKIVSNWQSDQIVGEVASPVKTIEPGSEVPQWARNNPRLYGAGQAVRQTLGPMIEGLSAAGGAVLGTPLGPAGNVGGAALGYGIGKGTNRLMDELLGNAAPVSLPNALVRSAGDVVEGAAWQAGGNIVGQQVIPAVGKGASWAGGKVMDLGNLGKQKAAKIAREAIGDDLPAVKALLNGEGTVGELTATVQNPTLHALLERGLGRDVQFTQAVAAAAKNNDLDTLFRLAGGTSQTAAIGAQKTAKVDLGNALRPEREIILDAANTAGRVKPALDAQAERMGGAAASKVQDVRRFTEAGGRAAERANTTTYPPYWVDPTAPAQAARTVVPGYPRQPGRYTYMGDLEKKAEQVATQAAADSLPLGENARFLTMQSDSLAAHGLRPLTPDSLKAGLGKVNADPNLAGKSDVESAIGYINKELEKWTNKNGIISAEAVDSLRKNAVNSVITDKNPGIDAKQKNILTAKVMSDLKPYFVSAIEDAGGTGYGEWLKKWSAGEQAINQKQMAAKLMELYQARPGSAAKVIEGDATQRVEKIFGPGAFNLRKEMESMNALEALARGVRIREGTAAQAADPKGQEALLRILKDNTLNFKFPFLANPKITVTNAVLSQLEGKIGKDTMEALTKASKTGAGMQDLLNTIPASERVKVLQALGRIKIGQNAINVGVPTARGLLAQPEQKQPVGLFDY